MLPDKTVLDKNVDDNYQERFGKMKLTKKAEKEVRKLLSEAVGLTYKLKGAIGLHNQNTKVHNAMVEVFNHKFIYPEANEEVVSESEDQEITQES